MFSQDFSCPDLLIVTHKYFISHTGLSPTMVSLSILFCYKILALCNRADPLSLATTLGISVDFFSSGYLDVSVLQVRLAQLCIHCAIPLKGWVSPFGHLRLKACLPAPRSFSQATTSFIAYDCQGIHHVHLFA